jgi:hypothetical protein
MDKTRVANVVAKTSVKRRRIPVAADSAADGADPPAKRSKLNLQPAAADAAAVADPVAAAAALTKSLIEAIRDELPNRARAPSGRALFYLRFPGTAEAAKQKWQAASADKRKPYLNAARTLIKEKRALVVKEVHAIIECPVCWQPTLVAPVYTCREGHLVCNDCIEKIAQPSKPCPQRCGNHLTVAHRVRCRPFEDLNAKLMVPCTSTNSACTKDVLYADLAAHIVECGRPALKCAGIFADGECAFSTKSSKDMVIHLMGATHNLVYSHQDDVEVSDEDDESESDDDDNDNSCVVTICRPNADANADADADADKWAAFEHASLLLDDRGRSYALTLRAYTPDAFAISVMRLYDDPSLLHSITISVGRHERNPRGWTATFPSKSPNSDSRREEFLVQSHDCFFAATDFTRLKNIDDAPSIVLRIDLPNF